MSEDEDRKIKELKEILPLEKPQSVLLEGASKIFFDGKQYAVRIPKKIVQALDLDLRADRFIFKATIPPKFGEDNIPKLQGELVRGKE